MTGDYNKMVDDVKGKNNNENALRDPWRGLRWSKLCNLLRRIPSIRSGCSTHKLQKRLGADKGSELNDNYQRTVKLTG